jgi:restriction endonuclease S subunit
LKGEIEDRLEPFYYVPSIVELENKIRKIANGKLKDYALKMSSGATPLKSEEEKYYSDAENGIPFIRVQNLKDTNELSLDDLKYITYETHQKDLKRSQVAENDLLVKITGVGRMAVSCVPPLGFEGNTNQHLVVIKTKDRLTSETLATYLNTDIVEKLASRRSTGGTRPALDYTSLKSIPVIFKTEIVYLMKKAVENKYQKEAEAKELLASIDAYLLEQLGIALPDKIEEKNVFYVAFSKVQGNRFDPFYHKDEFEILDIAMSNGKYGNQKLGIFLSQINYGASVKSEYVADGIPFLRISDLQRNEISITEMKYLPKSMQKDIGNAFVYKDDFLISRSGTIGIVARVSKEFDGFAYGSFMIKFTLFENAPIDKDYLSYFLNCETMERIIRRNKIGAVQGNITIPTIRNLQIPLPPLEIQTEIANHIRNIRERAKILEIEAKEVIEKAKAEVEKMILGE